MGETQMRVGKETQHMQKARKTETLQIQEKIDKITVCGVSYGTLKNRWNLAKKLFEYKNLDKNLGAVLGGTLPGLTLGASCEAAAYSPTATPAAAGGRRNALATWLLAGIVIFAIAFLAMVESIYLANFASETLADATGISQPKLDFSIVPLAAAYQFCLYVLVGTAINYLHEGLAYIIARTTGGKATFDIQTNSTSVVWLSAAMSMVVALIAPFPCITVFAFAAVIIVTLGYFMVYVMAKTYERTHEISFFHALAIVLLLLAPRVILWILATNYLTVLFGLSGLMQGA